MTTINTHNRLISDANILSLHVTKYEDPIEPTLSRWLYRTGTVLLGSLFSSFPGTLYLIDAAVDREKLKKIQTKLIKLETIELDRADENQDKACQAHDFQKAVYENIKKYTETAKNVKTIAGLAFLLLSFGLSYNRNSPDYEFGQLMAQIGFIIGGPVALWGISHWAFDGHQLNKTNQDLVDTWKVQEGLDAL